MPREKQQGKKNWISQNVCLSTNSSCDNAKSTVYIIQKVMCIRNFWKVLTAESTTEQEKKEGKRI